MDFRGRSEDEAYDLEGYVETQTGKAMLIHFTNSGESVWVPKSQIHEQSEVGTDAEEHVLFNFRISAWLVRKNNL